MFVINDVVVFVIDDVVDVATVVDMIVDDVVVTAFVML